MTTTPITGTSSNQITTGKKQLDTDSFIKMMITQLQNQDPLNPTSNQDLMAQMNQIGQLQSTTQMQQTLTSLALQTQIGSAGNLIGKSVEGLDDQNEKISGLVQSVRVEKDGVYLELDNGQSLGLSNVTLIAPGPAPVTTAGSAAAAAA